MDALRQKFTPFVENIVPKKKEEPRADHAGGSSPAPPVRPGPGIGGERGAFPFDSSQRIPPVGSGDVLPPGLGGGEPGMLVGPDSALFGRRFDPSQGPVPGSRFDPYGPPIDPLRMPGFGGVGGRGGRPGPNVPFGAPNPDHLRMPREDDDMDFGFGRQPERRGGGDPTYRPFGSDHSFF